MPEIRRLRLVIVMVAVWLTVIAATCFAGQSAVNVATVRAAEAAFSAEQAGHGHQAAEQEGPPINPLSFQTDLALWTAVVFLVLLAILARFAWGPIARGLEKREQYIADQIAAAERDRQEAKRLLAEYQEQLNAAGQKVEQMLEEARRNAEKVGQEIVERAQAQAEAEHRRRMEELDRAANEALQELARRSADLAVQLAGKILATQLDPAAHAHLVEQAVKDFTRTKVVNN